MATLGFLDWLIFAGYVAVVFGLGVWFAREQHSNEDYFVGGRRMNWFAVGLSLFAGTFSSLSFVGLPREAAYADYHLYLAILFIPFVVTPVLWLLFVPLYLRLELTSVYEYLERRFNRPLRRMGSLLYAGYSIGWMGSMLFAVGVILQAVLGLTEQQLTWSLVTLGLIATIYTSMGGVKAVIWTDVLQALTLGGGMLLVLLSAVERVEGGWATVWEIGTRDHKFDMFRLDFDLSEANFYAACAFGVFVYLASHTTSFAAVQRYVSMPSLAAARRALVVNGLVIGLVCGLFFMVGTALYVFYHQSPGGAFPELPREDQLVPHFVMSLHRSGLAGLLMAGLFAAAMSSVDTGINSLTAMLIYDWLDGRDFGVGFSRTLCALFGVAVIGSALLVPYLGQNVFDIIIKISGTFFGPLFAVFLLGVLVPWANAPGAIAGLIAGAISLAVVWQATEVSHWWYGALTCIPTFLVGFVISPLFPRPRRGQLDGLCLRYKGSRRSS